VLSFAFCDLIEPGFTLQNYYLYEMSGFSSLTYCYHLVNVIIANVISDEQVQTYHTKCRLL